MNDSLARLQQDFEIIARAAQTLAFLPPDTQLQVEVIERIDKFTRSLTDRKSVPIREEDETSANILLSMELVLTTVRHQLQLWIELKTGAAESAWDNLVDAQQACDAAIGVRRQVTSNAQAQGLENLLSALRLIEQLVFPPQVFLSIGASVRSRKCSVCNGEYDQCGHIRGRAYMGKLCHTILHELDIQEVSIVPYPANKRARVTQFADGDKWRNRMTWRLDERHSDPS